ncbi:unnamed protein product [Rhizoctonia solani]|uniref:Uncharacterized protein n=1 Tax=Rhizoctonia solani TaxID=456999 RepID=A0A8H2XKR1_9AGAM|nr:unnamed protein product [Rhizoctonia solani]
MDARMPPDQIESLTDGGRNPEASLWSQNLFKLTNSLVEASARIESDRQGVESILHEILHQVECRDDPSYEGLDSSISALSNTSAVFDSYFEETQEPWYITQAILCQTCIVSLLPEDDDDRPGRLYGLAVSTV